MKPTHIKLRNSKVNLAKIYKETQKAKFYARTAALNLKTLDKWKAKTDVCLHRANEARMYFTLKLEQNKELFISRCGKFVRVYAPTIEYVAKDTVYISILLRNEYGQAIGYETVKFTELYIPCE